MDDRFKFICGVDVSYYSDDGDDKDVIVWFEPDSVTKYGEVGFDFNIIKNELKKLKLSQHEFNTAVDFIAGNYETSIQDWCVADPRHLLQCTGKEDKNRKLIFEGDIIKRKSKNYIPEFVYWHKELACFRLTDPKHAKNIIKKNPSSFTDMSYKFIIEYDIEIIGNVYKNPDLLESLKNETLDKN